MAMVKRQTVLGPNGEYAEIYRDTTWKEFQVRFYDSKGITNRLGNYYTPDRDDAILTARALLWRDHKG